MVRQEKSLLKEGLKHVKLLSICVFASGLKNGCLGSRLESLASCRSWLLHQGQRYGIRTDIYAGNVHDFQD